MKKKDTRSYRGLLTLAIIITFVSSATFTFYALQKNSNTPAQESQKATAQASQSKNTVTESTPNTNGAAQEQVVASKACMSFTEQVALQIFVDATLDPTESVLISDTPDIITSSCTYTNGAKDSNRRVVRLTSHIAKTTLGKSSNGVKFGSEKPRESQDVPGYGQAAFWDNATNTLYVLKDNNYYEITRTNGKPPAPTTLQDVKIAANAIVPKL